MSGSIIGSLIDAALFEFTSLEGRQSVSDGEAIPGATVAQDWASSLGDLRTSGSAPQRQQFEAGNLSALEDDSPFSRSGSMPLDASSPAPPVVQTPIGPTPEQIDEALQMSHSGGGKGTLVLIFVLVLLAGLAGAWFGGLIPKGALG